MINDINNKKVFTVEVVEDDSGLLGVLRDKFTLEGFRVLQAKNGEEGLATAISEQPDLILLDIMMPKMDGITMMRKLRRSSNWGKTVPIVLLTNLSADDDKINRAITDDEPAYYLVKSDWTISNVVEKVRDRLSRQYFDTHN